LRVCSFLYFRPIMNKEDSMSEEITHRELRKEIEPIVHIED